MGGDGRRGRGCAVRVQMSTKGLQIVRQCVSCINADHKMMAHYIARVCVVYVCVSGVRVCVGGVQEVGSCAGYA